VSKIILKYCPVCSKLTEHIINNLQHQHDETFEMKYQCRDCSTPFTNFFQHQHLLNFKRISWSESTTNEEEPAK